MSSVSIAFSGSPLDRADMLRADPGRLAALIDSRARLLQLDGLEPRLDEAGRLVWTEIPAEMEPGTELIFLGLGQQGEGRFVAVPSPEAGNTAPPSPRLWSAMGSISAEDLAIYGAARSIAGWHARHGFCARCGSPTTLAKGGWQRNCLSESCRAEHFPRVDPVVIMTVEHEGSLLLGRQPRFPPRRYTALAGFLEPGETMEEAVAREVWEEAGLRVRQVRYVTSQPWPFPSSLMLACHAMAEGRDLEIDRTELEDARWFTREEVTEAMNAGAQGRPGKAFDGPPRHAVAWHLLDRWVNG